MLAEVLVEANTKMHIHPFFRCAGPSGREVISLQKVDSLVFECTKSKSFQQRRSRELREKPSKYRLSEAASVKMSVERLRLVSLKHESHWAAQVFH